MIVQERLDRLSFYSCAHALMRKTFYAFISLLVACATPTADIAELRMYFLLVDGVAALERSDNPAALEKLNEGLELARQRENRQAIGAFLGNLGVAYGNLGQYANALDYSQQALEIRRELGDRKGEGIDLGNIGAVYTILGEYAKALDYFEQALVIRREIGDRKGEGSDLTNIGVVYRRNLGQYAKALDYFEQALEIHRELGDRSAEALDLNNIAVVHEVRDEYAKARDTYQQPLALLNRTRVPEYRWVVWMNLYSVTEKLNNPNAAIFYGKQAINTIQMLRSHVARLDDESLSQSFLENKEHVYQGVAELLMRQGRLFEAQKVLAMLKQEEYFDFIRRARAFEVDESLLRFALPEQPWEERYAEISTQLVDLGGEYGLLRDKKSRGAILSAEESRRLATLRKDLTVAERALQAWFKDMNQALASLKQENLQTMLADFDDERQHIQQLLQDLGEGTVLLHYVPMPETLHILVTTPELTMRRESAV